MKEFFETLLDVLLPTDEYCLVCAKSEKIYSSFICEECEASLLKVIKPCRLCGRELHDELFSVCAVCQRDGTLDIFEKIKCLYILDDFSKIILYKYKFGHARYFSHMFAAFVLNEIKTWDFKPDVVVPLISGKNRIGMRAFDHIDDICAEIEKLASIPNIHILERTHHDIPQSQLKRKLRAENVVGAFEYCDFTTELSQIALKKNIPLSELKILLIDDVYTTGATIREACFVLREQFNNISAICIFEAV